MKLIVRVNDIPGDGEIELTDIMLQPGGNSSGWLPHITELPWSAGVSEDTGA